MLPLQTMIHHMGWQGVVDQSANYLLPKNRCVKVARIGGAPLPHGHKLCQGRPMEVAPVGPLSQTGVNLGGIVVDTQVTGMAESLI